MELLAADQFLSSCDGSCLGLSEYHLRNTRDGRRDGLRDVDRESSLPRRRLTLARFGSRPLITVQR